MIAKKVRGNKKGNIIEIQFQESVDELESFTLLNITEEESKQFLNCCFDFEVSKDKFIIYYKYKDNVDRLWNYIYSNHDILNKDGLKNISKKYIPSIESVRYLIRDQDKHIIYGITDTNSNKECSINVLKVSETVFNIFMQDVAKSSYNLSKIVYNEDCDIYLKWSSYMNRKYLESTNQK